MFLLTSPLLGQNIDYGNDSAILFFQSFQKTQNWVYADTYYREKHKYTKSMTLENAIQVIKSETDYWALRPAINSCIENYKSSVPILLEMLLDTTTVGLASTRGILFLGRPVKSEPQIIGCISYPIIRDDIFTVSGRSSYILNQLTNENLLIVKSTTSYFELQCYKELWRSWFRRL